MMRVRAYITHKAGENFADCQDRFSINARTGSVALCDGMSQSLFPKYWAEILSNRYTEDEKWDPSLENVRMLTPFWESKVESRLKELRQNGIDTWRTENMIVDGVSAGSTLAGIRFDGDKWKCNLLGDSCLVIIDNYLTTEIYSSMDTSHFDNYPDYFDSDSSKMGKGNMLTVSGMMDSRGNNQEMLLVSDPLGDFISKIKGSNDESAYIRDLLNVESADEFEILVDYWRRLGMHNDDTTLVIMSPTAITDEPFKRQEEWIW